MDFIVSNLRLKNIGSDVPAVIAQRALAGVAGEPYHYSLVNFAVLFDVERPTTRENLPRIFHRIRCELDLLTLQKHFEYDITVDMPEGEEGMEVERPFYGLPIGQPKPCSESLRVRLLNGASEIMSITAPVTFLPK